MASSFLVRVRNAHQLPLPDRVDVEVIRQSTGSRVAMLQDVSGKATQRISGLNPLEVYSVRVFPMRHRPVGQFVMAPPSGDRDVTLVCPIHPDRVVDVRFPEFRTLAPGLASVLDHSDIEGAEGLRGGRLWDRLDVLQRAGLLNIYVKMLATVLPNGAPCWSFIDGLYRVRGDRIFANVRVTMRDVVKTAVAAGQFREVSDKLHTPPPGFQPAGSFKTHDAFGNLQVSFFSSLDVPLRFRVDTDIDNAAGLRHVFHVLSNWIGDGDTHPFDIQQILVYQQQTDPGYELIV